MNATYTTKLVKDNKNIMLLFGIILLSLGLLYYVLFVNTYTSQLLGTKPVPTPPPAKNYSSLDESLNTIVGSNNPKETAEKDNLAVEAIQTENAKNADEKNDVTTDGSGVKVLITLNDESFVFTDEYGKEVLRYGKYIQALVKFDKLEELAKNPKIKSIVAPLKSNIPK